MADALQTVLSQAALALAPLRAIKTADQAAGLFRKLGYEIPAGALALSYQRWRTARVNSSMRSAN